MIGTTTSIGRGCRGLPIGTGSATPSNTRTAPASGTTGSLKRSTISFGDTSTTVSWAGVADISVACPVAEEGIASVARRAATLAARRPPLMVSSPPWR